MLREVRGRGLMIGIEFGAPQSSCKAARALPALQLARKGLFAQTVVHALFHRHRILTQVSGDHIEVIKLIPPLIIGEREVDRFVDAFVDVMDDAHRGDGADPLVRLAAWPASADGRDRASWSATCSPRSPRAGNALANVMQRKSGLEQPPDRPFGPGLLFDLVRSPTWLLGFLGPRQLLRAAGGGARLRAAVRRRADHHARGAADPARRLPRVRHPAAPHRVDRHPRHDRPA